jgi:hypothetical protein
MKYEEDVREDLLLIVRSILEEDLEFSWSQLGGGTFYPSRISLSDDQIKHVFETLKREPFYSEILKIRRDSINPQNRKNRIESLVDGVIEQNDFYSFRSPSITVNFSVEVSSSVDMEYTRTVPSSTDDVSVDSVLIAKGEVDE